MICFHRWQDRETTEYGKCRVSQADVAPPRGEVDVVWYLQRCAKCGKELGWLDFGYTRVKRRPEFIRAKLAASTRLATTLPARYSGPATTLDYEDEGEHHDH